MKLTEINQLKEKIKSYMKNNELEMADKINKFDTHMSNN